MPCVPDLLAASRAATASLRPAIARRAATAAGRRARLAGDAIARADAPRPPLLTELPSELRDAVIDRCEPPSLPRLRLVSRTLDADVRRRVDALVISSSADLRAAVARAERFPETRRMSIRPQVAVPPGDLRGLRRFPSLERLDLAASAALTDEGLRAVADLPRLRELDVSYAGGVTLRGLLPLQRRLGFDGLRLAGCWQILKDDAAEP